MNLLAPLNRCSCISPFYLLSNLSLLPLISFFFLSLLSLSLSLSFYFSMFLCISLSLLSVSTFPSFPLCMSPLPLSFLSPLSLPHSAIAIFLHLYHSQYPNCSSPSFYFCLLVFSSPFFIPFTLNHLSQYQYHSFLFYIPSLSINIFLMFSILLLFLLSSYMFFLCYVVFLFLILLLSFSSIFPREMGFSHVMLLIFQSS